MSVFSGRGAPAGALRFAVIAVIVHFSLSLLPSVESQVTPAPGATPNNDGNNTTTKCYNGAQLVAAFANPAIYTAVIAAASIVVSEADWAAFDTPVKLQHNFTVMGEFPEPQLWPELDMSSNLQKIYLMPGVTLNFTWLASWMGPRDYPQFQSPGVPMIASDAMRASNATDPNHTFVVMWNASIVHWACFTNPAINAQSIATTIRPTTLPGPQRSETNLTVPPDCINSTSVPMMQRCWPGLGKYNDFAFYASDLDSNGQRISDGYAVWAYEGTYLCAAMMDDDCLHTYGAVGCFYRTVRPLTEPPPPSTPPLRSTVLPPLRGVSSGGDSGGGDATSETSSRHRTLAAILGGTLGGLAFCSLVIVTTYLVLRSRRQRLSGSAVKGSHRARSDGSFGMPWTSPSQVNEQSMAQVVLVTSADAGVQLGPTPCAFNAAAEGPDSKDTNTVAEDTQEGAGVQKNRRGQQPLRYTDDEIVMAPITALTPMQPGITFGVELQGGDNRIAAAAAAGASVGGVPPVSADSSADADSSVLASGRGGQHPTSIGRVELTTEVLGKGSFGRVMVGLYNGERVAVKMLNCGLMATAAATAAGGAQESASGSVSSSTGYGVGGGGRAAPPAGRSTPSKRAVESFWQEVQVLGRCQHPNIVRLLAVSYDYQQVSLVMELMDTSLDRLMYGRGPGELLPLPLVLHIAMQVARALSYMHPTILHRDLKPANVLITQPGSDKPVAKLADFGVSRLLDTVLVTGNPTVGTVQYVAPEAFDVNDLSTITDRVDIYAMGVLLWEMLSGTRPWKGCSIVQIGFAVTALKKRPSFEEIPAGRCPPKLRSLILSCWDAVPGRRPAAAEVLKNLVLIQEELSHPEAATSPQIEVPGLHDVLGDRTLSTSVCPQSEESGEAM